MKTRHNAIYILAKSTLCAAMAIFALGLTSNSLAQDKGKKQYKILSFETTVHDFGTFPSSDGPKHCSFTYKNETDTTILIYDVKPSCECTSVEWSKKPIKPGGKGVIKVTYANDAGTHFFNKGISVYTSTWIRPFRLNITGTVTE